MPLEGKMLVAGSGERGNGEEFHALRAVDGHQIGPAYRTASDEQVDRALNAAAQASCCFADSDPEARAQLLDAIAAAILAVGDNLIERAMLETGLPRARLEGERTRTAGQLRLFASLLREGDFAEVRIDRADPGRPSGPKPDLRMAMQGLGPVAVFGASNFPLAFSVAGGDTASALAAGCPVVVKGHPAHPGTGELVAHAVAEAVRASSFDAGVFSMLHDAGIAVGQRLVGDRRIKAVGFTGSRTAGEALMKIAAARTDPIPVYAEMSATNPVLLFPGRLREAADSVASAFVASLTLGSGQFCTNPGLILVPETDGIDRFLEAARKAIREWSPGVMLTPRICEAFEQASVAVGNHPGVSCLAASEPEDGRASARLFSTGAAVFLANPALHHEMFGPAALVVRCADLEEMERVLDGLEGQLTLAMHFSTADHQAVRRLLPLARRKAGRVLANGFGTGVEVSPAMVHGGPYPASSDSRSTSVGTLAIRRFLRPVCLQDFPDELLPPAVAEANPWRLAREQW